MLEIQEIKIQKERNRINENYKFDLFTYLNQKYLHFVEKKKLNFFRYINKNKNFFLNPKISIITPTYNRSDILLDRCVKSVRDQTYQNYEHIIVSDGSTDDTEKKILSLKDPKIIFLKIRKHISYEKKIENTWFAGPVRPLNTALKHVKGKWIAKHDDDDIWDKNHLLKSLEFCQTNKLEFLSSAYEYKKFNKSYISKPGVICDKLMGGSSTFFYVAYLKFIKFNPHCYKKKINKVNDTDLFERMCYSNVKVGYRDEVSMHIFPRPGESTIGLDQILIDKKNYEKKYL